MIFIVLCECLEVGVVQAFLDVERYWQGIKWVLSNRLIVIFHIHKERFLVAQMVVVLDLICQLDRVNFERLRALVTIRVGIVATCSDALLLGLFFRRSDGRLDDFWLRWGRHSNSWDVDLGLLSRGQIGVLRRANERHGDVADLLGAAWLRRLQGDRRPGLRSGCLGLW